MPRALISANSASANAVTEVLVPGVVFREEVKYVLRLGSGRVPNSRLLFTSHASRFILWV